MLQIDDQLSPSDLQPQLDRLWEVAGPKIAAIDESWDATAGSPVFTIDGKYTAQGWTEWTQGFQYGSALLQFDATGDERFLEIGRRGTLEQMASHVSHFGVHDHGFNNVSTYGALRRLLLEEKIPHDAHLQNFCELALKVSGAVQAARWSETADGDGYIYSFNGPHSLFCDTIRSLRALAVAHLLGHSLLGENDVKLSLLDRLAQHARTTARYNVYYGESRDIYDVRGRVAHESIFNTNDGRYRCPSTQQGYSPFTTWTRGLAWIMLGYPEQLDFLAALPDDEFEPLGGREPIEQLMLKAAQAACDFYIAQTPIDGIPYWDTGAPDHAAPDDDPQRAAEPLNDHEPVDSSAAAIAAQGLLRLGRYLSQRGDSGQRYWQAGLVVMRSLLSPPYLSEDTSHQGILLHTVYHRPRGWDYIPSGAATPRGESCMWGDYHLLEVGLYLQRILNDSNYYTFFGPTGNE